MFLFSGGGPMAAWFSRRPVVGSASPLASASRRLSSRQARLLAAVLTGLAVWLVVGPVVRATTAGTVAVVVTAHDVGAGVTLTAGDVTTARLPAAAVPGEALTDPARVVGRRLNAPATRGEPLTSARLTPTRGLATTEVALVLPLDPQTAAALKPGDVCDLLFGDARHVSSPAGGAAAKRVPMRILSLFGDSGDKNLTINGTPSSSAMVAVRSQDANEIAGLSTSAFRAVLIRPYP